MRILLLSAMLCRAVLGLSQPCTHTLMGTIVQTDGTPLTGATLQLAPVGRGTLSSETGTFQLRELCAGKFTLTVRFVGFKTLSQEVTIPTVKPMVLTLEEMADELGELEIVAHHDPSGNEHVQSFTLLNSKKLGELAGMNLGELTGRVAGVTLLQTGPGVFKPVIHGMHSNRILIINNGVRQESQQWGADHAPEIDAAAAGEITLIKDASVLQYGPDAMGGVLTVKAPELPSSPGYGGSFRQVYHSNSRAWQYQAMVEGRGTKPSAVAWRLQSSGRWGGDYFTPRYSLTNTGIRELNISMMLEQHIGKAGWDFQFSRVQSTTGILKGTGIGNLEDLAIAMERPVPLYTHDFSYELGPPQQRTTHYLSRLRLHTRASSGEWNMQYAIQWNRRQEFDLRIGQLTTLPAMDLSLVSQQLDLTRESNHEGPWLWLTGFSASLQNNQNVPGTQRIPFIPDYRLIGGGIFSLLEYQQERLKMTATVRSDYRNYLVSGYDFRNQLYSHNFSMWHQSYSMTASWQGVTWNHALTLGNTWRPPHVAELFSLGTHQSVAAIEYGLMLNSQTNQVQDPTDSFQPERGTKLAVTSVYSRGNWRIEVNPYIQWLQNFIYLRPEGVTINVRGAYPYFRYVQSKVRFMGMDITTGVQISPSLRFEQVSSWVMADDLDKHDVLLYIPALQNQLSLRYMHPRHGFYVEGGVRFVARQTRAPRVLTVREILELTSEGEPITGRNFDFMEAPPSYALLQSAAGYEWRTRKVKYELRLTGENLANTTFKSYTNRFRYYAYDAGRNIRLSINIIF